MKNLIPIRFMLKLFLAFCVAFGSTIRAENVFITSFIGNAGTTDLTPAPHSVTAGFAGTFGASSASMSTASPSPGVSPRRIQYSGTPGSSWAVTPADGSLVSSDGKPTTFIPLQNIGVYKIYVTKGQSGNASTNIIVTMTGTENGEPITLADSNGVGSASIPLNVYQRAQPNHVWVHVGYITNTTPSPTITFTHTDGAIDNLAPNDGQRWYVDAVWFEFVDQCSGVAPQVGIAGPLAQGQGFVNVLNVADGATNVTIYANGSEIGQTNSVTGFAGGALTVATTLLNMGDVITAVQSKTGCDSLLASSGPVVGGGANPQIRAFLGLWKDSTLAGPVGANVYTNNLITNYFLKADGLIGGFGTAFTGGETLFPGQCWQTATFSNDDLNFTSQGSSVFNEDPFAAFSGLAFSIEGADSGPYEIYVDQIVNGDVVIEDFESYAVGSTNTLGAPNTAALPSPTSTYLPGHNSTVISDDNAFDGAKSARIQWQWVDGNNIRWAYVPANASTNSGKHYPQIDVTKPITVRYLVLPVGETTNKLSFITVPVNQAKAAGDNATFTVEAVGDGPFSYQWSFAQQDTPTEVQALPDVGPSLTVNNIDVSKAGFYSVVVTGPECSATLSATLSIGVEAPTITYSLSGSTLTLNWEGTFNLQSKADLNEASWTNVGVSTGPYVTEVTGAARFYRLQAAD